MSDAVGHRVGRVGWLLAGITAFCRCSAGRIHRVPGHRCRGRAYGGNMRKLLIAAALVVSACGNQTAPVWTNASGSVGLSRDDQLVYALDKDNRMVAVHDARTLDQVRTVGV